MAKIDTKNLVLHGVGEAFLLSGDGKVSAKLGSLQDMTIEVTATMEDVFGGDGLFPIYNYIKEKSASFKFKNACFDLNVVAASQGEAVAEGAFAFGSEDIVVKASDNKLLVDSGVEVESVIAVVDGVGLTRVEGSPTGTKTFAVTSAGVLDFSSDLTAGTQVHIDYVYTVTDGSTVDVKTTSVPGYVELRHTSQPTELPNGRKAVLTTRVYNARCEGGLTLSYARGEATAPELNFKSVDPLRGDKKFVSYSVSYVD